MFYRLLVLSIVTLAPTFGFSSGSYVGNGGDTVYCRPSLENTFKGYFTLDYLLEYKTTHYHLIEIQNLTETVNRLRRVFTQHYPEILASFNDFFTSLAQRKGTVNRIWVAADKPLEDIHDESIAKAIPTNCLREGRMGSEPDLRQTVIREAFYDPVVYRYDSEVLRSQEVNNPLQYSFFMIHEWLWDVTTDVRVVRKLNWLLHSQELDLFRRNDFVNLFEGFNLFQLNPPYCSRSYEMKRRLLQDCADIRPIDLRSVTDLEFDALPKGFIFRFGDFAGFSKVTHLKIHRSKDLEGALHPRIFYPLHSLKSLDLSDNDLRGISLEVTKDLVNLKTLVLTENPITKIPSSFIALESLRVLEMSLNEELLSRPEEIANLPPALSLFRLKDSGTKRRNEVLEEIARVRPQLTVEFYDDL